MIKTLVLSLEYPSRASYYNDWAESFKQSKIFDTQFINIFERGVEKKISKVIHEYELIILLHACMADSLLYVKPLENILKARKAKLIAFVGNEYNVPTAPLSEKIKFLKAIEANIIATQLLQEAGEWLYQDCKASVISLPHALNEHIYKPSSSLDKRPIDIGSRTFKYPVYLGDNKRNFIGEEIKRLSKSLDMKVDISDRRFDRLGWAAFLNRCKGTVSTEAGTDFLERDDATVLAIADFIKEKSCKKIISSRDLHCKRYINALPFWVKTVLKKMVALSPFAFDVDMDPDLDPNEVSDKFFHQKKCPVYSKCVSSRHFEAAGTKTLQIMFEGRFNDIFKPDIHYIALKEDFSNFAEVLEKFRDPNFYQRMVNTCYEYVLSEHTYEKRLLTLSKLIS